MPIYYCEEDAPGLRSLQSVLRRGSPLLLAQVLSALSASNLTNNQVNLFIENTCAFSCNIVKYLDYDATQLPACFKNYAVLRLMLA